MSFCRITGKARGLPRPNYFPLLPPISPADAKRFCRITGKAYGLPGHHYTPVLLVRQNRKEKDRITGNAVLKEHSNIPTQIESTEPQRHVVVAEFRYVFPTLETLDQLEDMLTSVKAEVLEEKKFVYTVDERRCSLVIPARLEAAVRDGQVRGVLLAEEMDKVCFQFRKGGDVTVGVCEMIEPQDYELFDGEGPSKAALTDVVKRKKNKRKKTEGLSSMAKIFEEKERVQEAEVRREEEVKAKRAKVVEMKISATEDQQPLPPLTPEVVLPRAEKIEWHEFDQRCHRINENLVMCSGDWRDLVKPLIESWNWEEFEREAAAVAAGDARVAELPDPAPLYSELVDLRVAMPGLVTQPTVVQGFTSLAPVSSAVPLVLPQAQPDTDVCSILHTLPESVLSTAHADAMVAALRDSDVLHTIPDVRDIPGLIKALDAGEYYNLAVNASGYMVDLNGGKKFVPGISVETPAGAKFIPGQTIDAPSGPSFVPGITVLTEDGPMLLPGLLSNEACPTFVAGRILATRNGECFVTGQMVETPVGSRFMPGQTITTDEGPKFIAGQTVPLSEGGVKFVPGHTITSAGGSKFVPGQTLPAPDGTNIFVPGQCVRSTDGVWEFVPGQTQLNETGKPCFVAGQLLNTEEGECFVPGRVVNTKKGPCFVPGVTVEGMDGTVRFVAGRSIHTRDGLRFVKGHVLCTNSGDIFVPGHETLTDDGTPKFVVARSVEDAIVEDATEAALVAEAAAASVAQISSRAGQSGSYAVFGHMVQTISGVEFFPGPKAEGLPEGKVVPGQLHRSIETGDVHFVPGIEITEDGGTYKFVPGQVVETECGEQFVPGQVVDTKDGPKFVPGQVVETSTGPKFVPGQTIDTSEGARFIPGQIVDTKAGPTFIPGQVISTAEGSARFVPGEVLNTAEGPRFVPGRVIETRDRVTFVPGHVVETKEGLHFIAPDLIDGREFHVQGFEVTPEELRLLRPIAGSGTGAAFAAVDARALQRLAAAGIAVGRHVPADLSSMTFTADSILASTTVQALAERLTLQPDDSVKLFEVLHLVLRLSTELLMSAGSPSALRALQPVTPPTTSENIDTFVRSLVFAVALAMSQEPTNRALDCAAAVLDELLMGVDPEASSALMQSMHAFLSVPGALEELRSTACDALRAGRKLELLRSLVTQPTGEASVAERLVTVLGEGRSEEALGEAFVRLTECRPDLVERVLGKVSLSAGDVVTEREAVTAVQSAIVSAVQESSEQHVLLLLDSKTNDAEETCAREEELHSLVTQAVALARALGLFETASALLEVLEDPATTAALAHDSVAMDVLKRLTVMRTLSQRRPAHAAALRRLQNNPFEARDDPHLCELVRETAVLMVTSNRGGVPLTSAADIPVSLLLSDNQLAVEDFLARGNPRTGPLLILKPGLQIVIPREASRAVLTGQVAYTVLDSKGIRHFEPLHVLSALRLPRFANHRFTMYRCAVDDVSPTPSLTSSCEDLTSRRGSWAFDSLLGSSVSTRRRSSDLRISQRCTSLDTGAGTVTESPASEDSIGAGNAHSALRPMETSLQPGYLDSETRFRIAAALAGRPFLPRGRLQSRSPSVASLTEASTSPSVSHPSPPNSATKSRETSPISRTYLPHSRRDLSSAVNRHKKNSASDLTPNQQRILEELRRNSYAATQRKPWRGSEETPHMTRLYSLDHHETSPSPRYTRTSHDVYRNTSPSPSRSACSTFRSLQNDATQRLADSSPEFVSTSFTAAPHVSECRDTCNSLSPPPAGYCRPLRDSYSSYRDDNSTCNTSVKSRTSHILRNLNLSQNSKDACCEHSSFTKTHVPFSNVSLSLPLDRSLKESSQPRFRPVSALTKPPHLHRRLETRSSTLEPSYCSQDLPIERRIDYSPDHHQPYISRNLSRRTHTEPLD